MGVLALLTSLLKPAWAGLSRVIFPGFPGGGSREPPCREGVPPGTVASETGPAPGLTEESLVGHPSGPSNP